MDAGTAVKALRAALSPIPQVRLAYLHGSLAKGAPSPRDIDLAVLVEEPTGAPAALRLELDLHARLADVFPGRNVDITLLHEAPLTLRFQVIRHGRLVLARDELARIDFEAWVMRETQDRHYYDQRGDAWLLERIRERGLA